MTFAAFDSDRSPVEAVVGRVRRTIGIGVLGCGTVGGSVVARLLEGTLAGAPVRLGRVLVRDLEKPRSPEGIGALLTADPADVLDDPSIDVVVETIGGVDDAYEFVTRALLARKHVVTSNKALVAEHGPKLNALARERSVAFKFEASVGGAVPIVRVLSDVFATERVDELVGVINGTTNYVLRTMAEGSLFDDAVRAAQTAGYAEADPSLDIDGIDAAQKLAVLSFLAFDTNLAWRSIRRVSLRVVTRTLVEFAIEHGFATIPLALARRAADGAAVEALVTPAFVPSSHDFARLGDVENMVRVSTYDGSVYRFAGPGAGSATASAVLSDLGEIARKLSRWESQRPEAIEKTVAQAQAPALRMLVRVNPNASASVYDALARQGFVVERRTEEALVIENATHEALERATKTGELRRHQLPMLPLVGA
jgi:homoserine dehydrogenase